MTTLAARVRRRTGQPPHQLVRQLRQVRTRTGRSQQVVADLSGLHQSTIADYEGGRITPSLPSLEAWAGALGYNLALTPKGTP